MCGKHTHAMPAIGVCLLAGIVQGCAGNGWLPATRLAPADTTALGVRAELPPTSMWPGEARRMLLPTIASKTSRFFEIRGDQKLTFNLDEMTDVYSNTVTGALEVRSQRVCMVCVDSLATPGDTLSLYYTISSFSEPPRESRWRMRIVIGARPPVEPPPPEPIQFVTARPNPFNPETTVQYTVTARIHVSVIVYDVRGQPVRTLINAVHSTGVYTAAWDGCDERGNPVGSGVYFVRLKSPAGTRSYKMTLLK